VAGADHRFRRGGQQQRENTGGQRPEAERRGR
jgi:hypothetical protein